jgi:glycosyl hydrolase family 79
MALWIVDVLFADAAAGVDSVNVHTWPGAVYQLFRFTHPRRGWSGSVFPEFYGLLLFARAAPPGSRLLTASTSNPLVRAWATRGTDGRIRVTLINDDTSDSQPVSLTFANTNPASVHGATLELLRAPGPLARSGVSLAGQSFGTQTRDGALKGKAQLSAVPANNGVLSLQLPPASAGLLTVQ